MTPARCCIEWRLHPNCHGSCRPPDVQQGSPDPNCHNSMSSQPIPQCSTSMLGCATALERHHRYLNHRLNKHDDIWQENMCQGSTPFHTFNSIAYEFPFFGPMKQSPEKQLQVHVLVDGPAWRFWFDFPAGCEKRKINTWAVLPKIQNCQLYYDLAGEILQKWI